MYMCILLQAVQHFSSEFLAALSVQGPSQEGGEKGAQGVRQLAALAGIRIGAVVPIRNISSLFDDLHDLIPSLYCNLTSVAGLVAAAMHAAPAQGKPVTS